MVTSAFSNNSKLPFLEALIKKEKRSISVKLNPANPKSSRLNSSVEITSIATSVISSAAIENDMGKGSVTFCAWEEPSRGVMYLMLSSESMTRNSVIL